jgi:FkbM family methyltransferase
VKPFNGSFRQTVRKMGRAVLPQAVLRRVADYRFGYTGTGRAFGFEVTESDGAFDVVIDGRIRLRSTRAFLDDLRFHFVDNGQSRNEVGAFIDECATLPADALLIDVGAHRGLFALLHCALGPSRRAVLLEPSASLAADARELLAMNGFASRADVRVCGAGERVERRTIVEDALGFARIVDLRGSVRTTNHELRTIEAGFTTLDDEWRRIGRDPAVVKIDVEGAEAEVLRGATALIGNVRPVLFLELHLDELRARGESVASMLAPLQKAGYQFYDPGGRLLSTARVQRSYKAILRLVARAAR